MRAPRRGKTARSLHLARQTCAGAASCGYGRACVLHGQTFVRDAEHRGQPALDHETASLSRVRNLCVYRPRLHIRVYTRRCLEAEGSPPARLGMTRAVVEQNKAPDLSARVTIRSGSEPGATSRTRLTAPEHRHHRADGQTS